MNFIACLRTAFTLGLTLAVLPTAVAAQGKSYTGICEDVFVPDYPNPGDAGTPTGDLVLIPYKLFEKSSADCAKRGSGPLANDKEALAHMRLRALVGDKTVLPGLRKLAEGGLAEANYLVATIFAKSLPVSPVSPDATVLTRAEAEARLRVAAGKDHVQAMRELAQGLAAGSLVRRDRKEATIWIDRLLKLPNIHPAKQANAALSLAAIILDDPEATQDERRRIKDLAAITAAFRGLAGYAKWLEIRGLRLGIGWNQDVSAARAMAEAPGLMDDVPPVKGEYLELLKASGTAEDRQKLAAILETAKLTYNRNFDSVAGEMLYDGIPAGRDRKRALAFFGTRAGYGHDAAIDLARRVVQSGYDVKISTNMLRRLYEAVDLRLPGADVALVELRQSTNSDARDEAEGIGLEALLGARSGEMAIHLLEKVAQAGPQPWYRPYDTAAAAAAAIDKFIAAGMPAALRIKSVALRRGTLYPQDDAAATRLIVQAAEAGDVAAMELAADAYDEGLGIAKSPAEEFRWMSAAAKAGSADAQRRLIFFMPFRSSYPDFNVHDALVSGLVLYADGLSFYDLPSGYDSVFRWPDNEKLGLDYLARGVMDGFRASLAARDETFMVRVFKKIPEDVKRGIETILQQEGYPDLKPDGFMGPKARTALAGWARAKGLPEIEGNKPGPSAETDARLTGVPVVPPEVIARLREQAMAALAAAKGKKAEKKAMTLVALLAQYGDLAPRLAILKGFSDSTMARKVVPPGLAVLYGIDVIVSNPPGAEKAAFDFIFMVSNMYQEGNLPIAADVVLSTLRDDQRLHRPEVFDKLADQFIFIPGYCDQLLAQAQKAKVTGLEADACSSGSRRALIAWAKASGPFGAEAQLRRQAADAILKLPN